MAKFKVIVDEIKLNGEVEATAFQVDAQSARWDADWIYFNSTTGDSITSLVAAFPTKRVIGVILDED